MIGLITIRQKQWQGFQSRVWPKTLFKRNQTYFAKELKMRSHFVQQ